MTARATVLAALLALAGSPLAAALAAAAGCETRMPSYADGRPRPVERVALDPAGPGELLYLAVAHTRDPASLALERMERELRRFEPTLILYEGDARGAGPDRRDSIRLYGETGLLRWAARELGVRAESLDVSAAETIAFLAERFRPEEVKIFFVLREMWLLRDRQGRNAAERRRLGERIVAGELLPDLPGVLETMGDFERAFGRSFPGGRWWEPRAEWFDPHRSGRATGGGFTNLLERAASVYRDVEMVRSIVTAVRSGERVFAAAGGGHLPMQAEALRCFLGP